MTEWSPIIDAVLAVIGTLLMVIGGFIAKCLSDLTESVKELNVNVAVIVEKVNGHENRIQRLETVRLK